MTYTPVNQNAFDATIRAAAESDGVIPDAVKVEAMAEALFFREMQLFIDMSCAVVGTWAECNDEFPEVANRHRAEACCALNALRALKGEC